MKIVRTVFTSLLLFYVATAVYQVYKPLPEGVRMMGEMYSVPAESVSWLSDETYVDERGKRHSDQQIFDEVLAMISRAREYLLVDMFLYNNYQGAKPETTRALSDELTEALVAQQERYPDMSITVVSDPINTVYGGAVSSHYQRLAAAGIPVVVTDLKPLRDSNPLYSAPWRLLVERFGNNPGGTTVPNPFSAAGDKVSVRSWLSLLNFKANHRKLVVADELTSDGVKLVTLVTSANPHDGSSAHSNVAIKVTDYLWRDAIASEQAVAVMSGRNVPEYHGAVHDRAGDVGVRLLTEGAILDQTLALIDQTEAGDAIDMAMFYLSERQVVRALLAASQRDVAIRLILDPNKDAFGLEKNGVPNRPVAHELTVKSDGAINIRWCDTHGEQCHSKLLLVRRGEQMALLTGSANMTKRNIGDYNLETNVLVVSDRHIEALDSAADYFDRLWHNRDGKIFTVDYDAYADEAFYKKVMYRVQEKAGLSSF